MFRFIGFKLFDQTCWICKGNIHVRRPVAECQVDAFHEAFVRSRRRSTGQSDISHTHTTHKKLLTKRLNIIYVSTNCCSTWLPTARVSLRVFCSDFLALRRMYWVWVPGWIVYVTRNLRPIVQGRQGQNCLFRRDYRTKFTTSKIALGSSADEDFQIVKFPRVRGRVKVIELSNFPAVSYGALLVK